MGNCWPKPVESLPSGLKPPSSPVPPPENSKDAKKQPHQPTSRNKSPRGVHNVDDHHLEGGGAAASRAKGARSNPSGAGNGHGNKNEGKIMTSPNLKMFTYAELRSATRNFRPDTVLGEGGFGRVFKGWVDEKTYAPSKVGVGIPVAVKKSNPDSEQGLNEWQAEVNFLGKFSHPNLVRLLGYCWEDREFLLVYEHMQRGSLESHLFRRGAETLSWETRLKIAVGAARGLEFLHTTEKQVIYRDFKASNILLDTEFNAKLSDFGLAKLGPINGNSHVTTQVVGTLGYAAPEYMATGYLYVKSDVYGFGVVLLEIISGRRVIDLNQPTGEHNLVDWAKPLLTKKRKLRLVIDPQLEGQYPLKAAMPIAELILKCLEHDQKKRPSMEQVLGTLEQINSIKTKPKDKDRSPAQHKKRDVQRKHNHHHPYQNHNKQNSASAIGGPAHPMLL